MKNYHHCAFFMDLRVAVVYNEKMSFHVLTALIGERKVPWMSYHICERIS